jgi:PAS domain S-box-containing protein
MTNAAPVAGPASGHGWHALLLARWRQQLLVGGLLTGILVGTWLVLLAGHSGTGVPVAWPAAGLMVALYAVCPPDQRRPALAGATLLVLGAQLVHGVNPAAAAGFSVACLAGAWCGGLRLFASLGDARPGLLDQGDVSRLVSASTLAAAVAAAGVGITCTVTGQGNPWLGTLAAFGTHAASLLMLLPFFLEGPRFAALATYRERLVQAAITLGTTGLIFASTQVPPVVFAVMPMFAWLALRGTLREAGLLLLGVAAIATVLTSLQLGPVYGLLTSYGLAPELVSGFLQLFLVDCALLLLPLSVMVTQQRMSAARVARQHQTLQQLVNAANGTSFVSIDLQGRVVVFNPGAEAMFGCTAAYAARGTLDRFIPPAERRAQADRLGTRPVFADLCAAAAAQDEGGTEWHFQRRDGRARTMRMTVTAVHDERGAVTGHLCIAEDVTEEEAAHRALVQALDHERQAVDRLRELERVKGEFVATVSHELRTPITSMVGFLELLEDGAVGELTDAQLELVDRVRRNGRRLHLLVEDLLMLSAIEARRMTVHAVDTDLCQVVRRVHEAAQRLLVDRDLQLALRLPARPVAHHGDPDQLERALFNVVSNAVKFTRDGGRVDVTVDVLACGRNAEIVVTDTGIGIPSSEQENLFTRFWRSSTAYEQAIQGTGLGLTIAQAIITQHEGQISISSVEDEGTVVRTVLPCEPAAGSAPVSVAG